MSARTARGTPTPLPPGTVEVLRYEEQDGRWYRIERFTAEGGKVEVITGVLVTAAEALAEQDPLGWFHGHMRRVRRRFSRDDWDDFETTKR